MSAALREDTTNREIEMSHNQQITKFIAESVFEQCKANGADVATQFKTREKFIEFVFSLSIKMVQQVLGCEFAEAYDIVMGDGEFSKLAGRAYSMLTA